VKTVREKVLALIEKVDPLVREYRHEIHAHPELGMEEVKTATLVQRELTRIGIPYKANVGKMGVVGLIEGSQPGPCIALRADMDALPIQETTNLPWASRVSGVSHACGHDTHTAMLLGAAEVLWQIRKELSGSVKILFQPAEEMNPTGGMPFMIEDGILENPKIDAAMALHVSSDIPTGSIGYRAGAMNASSNRFYITVKGKAAHGSAPDAGIDAIVTAAQVIMGIQTIVSRKVKAMESAVLTIGTIKGGDRYNVIPETVTMEGTCRTLNPSVTELIPGVMEQVVKGICDSAGCTYEFRFDRGYPPVVSDDRITELVKNELCAVLGSDKTLYIPTPRMGGEDFSFLSQRVPSTFIRIGCTPEGEDHPAPAHNGAFNPDEDCFIVGVKAYVFAALAIMKG
jgi:amidohydrolase